ncbi:M36 family metallopeptidase [Myxococcus sp. K38C18041901]|uniref:M36 family metallopeptidase n=1 Tax=Myxococcus guangdongensis TaxID=2906760 RepID=UPI0020A7B393|nr:M36 family metallopeptidase [Myxococcus guangdongensis]MCP3061952.1 M36 family metallopeptidase [Myxococcus guangdongensis]
MAKSPVRGVTTVVSLMLLAGCAVEPLTEATGPLRSATGNGTTPGASVSILSRDEARGVPTLVWMEPGAVAAPSIHGTPEAAAWDYLEQHASLYGLTPEDLGAAYVHRVHDVGRGGISVMFRQRVAGLEVLRGELKVLMTRRLELVGLTGNLRGGVKAARSQSLTSDVDQGFRYAPGSAVLRALEDLYGVSLSSTVREVGGLHGRQHLFDLAPGAVDTPSAISLVTPARLARVYHSIKGRLVPAYVMDVLAERTGDPRPRGYEYVVDASDGRVLERRNRISSEVFSYRVFAEPDGTPGDSPQLDFSPHPTGSPETPEPGFRRPIQVEVEGLTHPDGTVDPWLASNATLTSGNNVWAYADHLDPDGYSEGSDVQASVTPGTREFSAEYQPGLEPLETESQTVASIVQLFYTTNWLHDDYYRSGFDEAAGNAQANNWNRGGVGGDVLLAEAQNQGIDPEARNNAFAYVPADGRSPKLEMFLWRTREERGLTVPGQPRYTTGGAEFGLRRFERTGRLVLAEDGAEPRLDGCEALQNDVAGAIVLVERGNCNYEVKAVNAEAAGAAGLIVINHTPGSPPPDMRDVDPALHTDLPTLSITFEDGEALKALLGTTAVSGTMDRTPIVERDGSLDNTIVAHEWGHVLFHRLVGCDTPQCQALSEGWSDFIALHMMVRERDDLEGSYAVGGHAAQLLGQSSYYGVRRVPYSRDSGRNALRLGHIANSASLPTHPLRDNGIENAESHNAGEVWASMLLEGYLALLDGTKGSQPRLPSFEAARRRMADYVVHAMVQTPDNPTFTEQRDALLMVAGARDSEDMRVLAEAFRRRGAGSCAVAPPRASVEFEDVEESTELSAHLRIISARLDLVRTCDNDSVLDASESALVNITLKNDSPVTLTNVDVLVRSPEKALLFPLGATRKVDSLAPFQSVDLSIPVELDAALAQSPSTAYEVVATSAQACEPTVTLARTVRFNYDLGPSRTDRVEGHATTWTPTVLGGTADQAWRIVDSPLDAGERLWFARDGYDFADTVLETPSLEIPEGGRFVLRFEHRHAFAYWRDPVNPSIVRYWNGGVIELTRDGGASWVDAQSLLTIGYNGVLDNETGNALQDRAAFVAESPGWPERLTPVVLDFGTRLGGATVRLRFRMGSAWVFQAHGWEIDNITVEGTRAAPFLEVISQARTCALLAHAGEEQTVVSGEVVKLDGSRSDDPLDGALSYVWSQALGAEPTVVLSGHTTKAPQFTAPLVDKETVLEFQLTVSVPHQSRTARVKVRVLPPVTQPDAGEPDAGPPPDAGEPDAGPPPDAGEEPRTLVPPEMQTCAAAGGGVPLGLLGTLLLLAARRRHRG